MPSISKTSSTINITTATSALKAYTVLKGNASKPTIDTSASATTSVFYRLLDPLNISTTTRTSKKPTPTTTTSSSSTTTPTIKSSGTKPKHVLTKSSSSSNKNNKDLFGNSIGSSSRSHSTPVGRSGSNNNKGDGLAGVSSSASPSHFRASLEALINHSNTRDGWAEEGA